MKSACSQFEETEALLESGNNPMRESVNKTALNELIKFLQPFKDGSDALEEEKHPTLPSVVFYGSVSKQHLQRAAVSAAEAVEIEKRKACAPHFLNTELEIVLLHKITPFLWPQFCQLRVLPEAERLKEYAHVRELLACLTEAISQDKDETNNDVCEPTSQISKAPRFVSRLV